MEQRKGKRQLNQGVRVKRTEEKEKRADRSAERTREATAVRAKRTTESRAARGAETSLGQKLKAIHGKVRKAVHESRERNFPESNGVAGQLLLLLCGLAAYWGALGREKLRLARRSHIRRTGGTSRAAKWRRKKYYPLAFGGAALVIAATAVFVSRYTFGTTVIYEGQALDTVASELEAKRVTASIADITSETLGKTFTFSDSSIQYTSGLVERSAVVDRAELEEELTDEMGLVTQGYSLYINDELIGSTQYEGALEGLLDQLKESYISEDTLTVDFVEDVRIAKGYVPTESIMNLGQIAEILNSTKEGEVTYTVVKGDTWSGIANSHGMTTKELLAINPDFDINRLQIGDELTLSNAVPYLTVMVTERQNYVEDIQYDITYTDDATMYKGDYKVLSKGVYGTADVVADVTYVNGEETERTVISSVTLTEPVTEQRAQGAEARPSWYPTGSFRWPTAAASPPTSATATPASAARPPTIGASTFPCPTVRRSTRRTAAWSASRATRARWAMWSLLTIRTALKPIMSTIPRCSFPRDRQCTRASRSPRPAAAASPAASTATSASCTTAPIITRRTIYPDPNLKGRPIGRLFFSAKRQFFQ